MTSIEEVLAGIDSDIRKRIGLGSDFKSERMAHPSLGLTKALGGGFAYGRIATVHGSKSSTKTSGLLEAIAAEQKRGKVAAWIDAEKAFDSEWAQRLGVDTDQILISRASDMYRAGDEMVAFIKAGADIIVVDSVGALIQPSFLDDDGELAGMENTKQIGSFSKGLKAMIRSVNFVNDSTLIIFISQQTTFIANTYSKNIPEGGRAIEYYSSQVVKLNSPPTNMIEGVLEEGGRVFKTGIGRRIDWTVDYNKLGVAGESGSYEFYHAGDNIGVDSRLELIELAIESGIINKGGAWFTYGDKKMHGLEKVKTFLEDPKVFQEIKDQVL